MVYASVARLAVVPMQDLLELDETARFNLPSRPKGNWIWKITSDDLNSEIILKLRNLATTYARI
jgi:4-alpha-glucanotransferase